MPKPCDRKMVFTLLVFFSLSFAMLPFAYWVHNHLSFALTPSLPYRIFYLASPDKIAKGDYVRYQFRGSEATEIQGTFWFIKQVACKAGEALKVDGREFYCNGEFLGTAKQYSLKGNPLTPFSFDGVIPAGRLFVMGQHKDSYDSRYLGFVLEKDVGALALPLI